VCTEAGTVLGTVAADFFSNCSYSEIPLDNRIRHVPRCVHYHARGFRLETFWNFYVGSGSRTPELYSVSPVWFEYCFMYEKSIVSKSQNIVHSVMTLLDQVVCFTWSRSDASHAFTEIMQERLTHLLEPRQRQKQSRSLEAIPCCQKEIPISVVPCRLQERPYSKLYRKCISCNY
jgi:hypothetical protein